MEFEGLDLTTGAGWLVLETMVSVVSRFPWERFVRADPKEVIPIPKELPAPSKAVTGELAAAKSATPDVTVPTPPPQPSGRVSPTSPDLAVPRPGCTTADEALVVKGHLDGLARGWGGFGVLKTSKERLDKAVLAAKIAGAPEVSAKLATVAEKLPEVKTPEDAEKLAGELDTVLPEAWNLGRRCKGLTPEMLSKARELAKRVADGELTKEQAITELSETS